MRMLTKTALLAAAAVAAVPANAATVTLELDVAGIFSYGALGDPNNFILESAVPADAFVTGIGYDVTLEAFDPSYLSEIAVYFLDSTVGLTLTPAFDQPNPGTGTFSSGGIINLGDIDPTFPFAVTDGSLSLEFFESFDDASVAPDGSWLSGTMTIVYETDDVTPVVPEPASWAMMIAGFGLVGGALRSRRSSVAFA